MANKDIDIVPALLEKIKREFEEAIAKDKHLKEMLDYISSGKGDYEVVDAIAIEFGENLRDVFKQNITKETLPDGKMYYNIAERILRPTLTNNYDLISKATVELQTNLNKSVGIGIRGIKPELNKDKIDGLINKVCWYDDYDKAAWVLDEPIVNFSQSIVDDAVRTNAEFHAKSGIRATVERIATGKPCEYCSKLEGRYTYPDVPEDVYRRHRSCKCIVSYMPGDGRKQNVHTKKWIDPDELEKIERRKVVGLTDDAVKKRVKSKISKIEKVERDKLIAKDLIKSQRKKIGSLVDINNKEVYNKAVSGKRHKGVYIDAVRKTDSQLEKSIKSHVKQVELHQKKINNPAKYIENWNDLTHNEKAGSIRKWEKDKMRNAEAAEIEIMVKEKKLDERK
ncbi:MAG: hypothetical protein RSA49_05170 [Anaerovoracaceae bacterium]